MTPATTKCEDVVLVDDAMLANEAVLVDEAEMVNEAVLVKETVLINEAATLAWGAHLLAAIMRRYQGDALIFLQGQLGAGKTTLVRGMLAHLGFTGVVKSPTYTLLEPYEIAAQRVFHFDLYRVQDPQELEFVGIDEIVDGPGIKIFEWPERAIDWLPAADVLVELRVAQAEAEDAPSRVAQVSFAD